MHTTATGEHAVFVMHTISVEDEMTMSRCCGLSLFLRFRCGHPFASDVFSLYAYRCVFDVVFLCWYRLSGSIAAHSICLYRGYPSDLIGVTFASNTVFLWFYLQFVWDGLLSQIVCIWVLIWGSFCICGEVYVSSTVVYMYVCFRFAVGLL